MMVTSGKFDRDCRCWQLWERSPVRAKSKIVLQTAVAVKGRTETSSVSPSSRRVGEPVKQPAVSERRHRVQDLGLHLKKYQKVRIIVKAYESDVLDRNCTKITNALKLSHVNFVGPVPLPTKLRRYCVLTSPHVDKKARDHFEIRTHKRIIEMDELSESTCENLKKLDISAGVYICVKVVNVRKERNRLLVERVLTGEYV